MTSRTIVLLLFWATSAVAQIDIDTSPSGADALGRRFASGMINDKSYSGSGIVTASELSIPAKARKEFDKALEALGKQDLTRARRELSKAVVIDPAFSGAYNNMAVVCARLGDKTCEREALEKAIGLNNQFELAYVNWARMSLASSDFAGAEKALERAATLEPNDGAAMVLLAYSEFMQGRLADTIRSSERAHNAGEPHAFAHRLAARAYERQSQFGRAIAELEMFLKEDPTGPLADTVRRELTIVQSAAH